MTQENSRSLQEIINTGSPRTHEYQSISGKIRRRQKNAALKQIEAIFLCSPDEATLVYDEMKKATLGTPVKMVEVQPDQVKEYVSGEWLNPFEANSTHYLARNGMYVGNLTRHREGFFLNGRHILQAQIDQIWEVVPA